MTEEKIVTQKKLDELKKELEEYKIVKRAEIAKRIKEAKEYGDLSENSEYEEAKNQQAFVEGKIADLEDIIKNAKILDKTLSKHGEVAAGSKVILKNGSSKTFEYTLVGALESAPEIGNISIESPLGRSLLGKKINEKVLVNLPSGKTEFQIISIK